MAWALPFGLALVRCSPFAQWRGDFAALRDIAMVPMGYGGGVSTALAQVAELLPLGSKTFRTALFAAAALGLAGRCLYAIARRMLRSLEPIDTPSRWAGPLLAVMASLTATMTPLYQEESTVGGGAIIAVTVGLSALALGLSAIGDSTVERPMARLIAAGFLVGCALAERPGVAASVGLALVCAAFVMRTSTGGPRVAIPWRVIGRSFGALAAGAAIFSLPSLIRGVAPSSALALGGAWRSPPPLLPDLSSNPRLVDAFTDEVGWIPLGLAAFGATLLVSRRGGRVIALAPLVVVAYDVISRAALGTTPAAASVRMLALGCLACASTAGLFAGAGMLVRMRVPFARPSAALLVAFHATLVALIAETAATRADRVAQHGADDATELGLDRLPPASAILAGSPHWVWRLTAAQLVEGRRPDVVLLQRSLVARGRVAVELLAREPLSEPLFLSLALTGASDEASLAALSDARPLFLEMERGWTERVTSHLALDGAWLRFRTDPPSKTDRREYADATLDVLAQRFPPNESPLLDTDTRFVIGNVARAHAKVLLRQGHPDAAGRALAGAGGSLGVSALAGGGSYDVLFSSAVARLPIVRHMNDRKPDRANADAAPGRKR